MWCYFGQETDVNDKGVVLYWSPTWTLTACVGRHGIGSMGRAWAWAVGGDTGLYQLPDDLLLLSVLL